MISRRLVSGIGLAIAGGLAPSCASTPSVTTDPYAATTSYVTGYPLDRTLDGLLTYPHLDAVVIISRATPGEPQISNAAEAVHPRDLMVVTPITAVVETSLVGPFARGASLSFDVAGGRVGAIQVFVAPEIAPDAAEMRAASRLVVAGEVIQGKLQPYFVYTVDPDGSTLRSLLKSGSYAPAVFTLAQLEDGLRALPPQ